MKNVFVLLLTLVCSACGGSRAGTPALEPEPEPETASVSAVGEIEPVRIARAWAHGSMNIRSGPGTAHPVVGELAAGSELWIGVPDAAGWAKVYDPGQFSMQTATPRGWIFTRSTRLKPTPPPTRRGR